MTFQLPGSYRRLLPRHGVRVPAGMQVSEEGALPDRFWVVLSGRVAVYTEGADGRRSIAREAGPGESVGVAAALLGRPLFAAANAIEATELLAIPLSEVAEVFRAAPDLAVSLLREISLRENEGSRHGAASAEDVPESVQKRSEPVQAVQAKPAAGAQPPTAATQGLVRLAGSFDEESFFVDEAECPVSGTRFQYLRTRAGAMRPTGRDSDFRISYRGVNPTHYAVIVCPGCSFASYPDDFSEVEPAERRVLLKTQAQRDVFGRPNLGGERGIEAAVLSLALARHCYEARTYGPRRRAGLLHRQAWLERERGQHEAERRLLREARDAYKEAFERDGDLSEEAAVRAAYVIGDLALRLDEPLEAGRWLETCLRMPELPNQPGLERMVRDRLSEARQQLERLDEAS